MHHQYRHLDWYRLENLLSEDLRDKYRPSNTFRTWNLKLNRWFQQCCGIMWWNHFVHSILMYCNCFLYKVLTRYVGRKYVFMKDNKVFDKLIHQVLILNLILVIRNRHQRWAEANGKVIWVHHIFVTEIIS